MPIKLDTDIDVLGCIEPLRRLEVLGVEMSQSQWLNRSDPERTANQEEFARLQEPLPPPVLQLLRSRISSARRLVAPMRRAKCSSCCMSVPKGDYGSILAGRRPVFCQHCGVLLFADHAERANSAVKSR